MIRQTRTGNQLEKLRNRAGITKHGIATLLGTTTRAIEILESKTSSSPLAIRQYRKVIGGLH